MDDDAFAAYVLNNAPRHEIETLEKIVKGLRENIASRRYGKPQGLKVGSNVEATSFDAGYTTYGTVVRMSDKGCTIEHPDSTYTSRITYTKYAVRILDEFEWNRVSFSIHEREKNMKTSGVPRLRRPSSDRENAVLNRETASLKPKSFAALDGATKIFRGAYVHAHRPQWGTHEYGVAVEITPKSFIISSPETDWNSRIWASKHEIRVLTEPQWKIVETELKRRRAEAETLEEGGKQTTDYAMAEISIP